MNRITFSGNLILKLKKQWIQKYVVIAGLTLAYYTKKSEIKKKLTPQGVIPLDNCKISHIEPKKCIFHLSKKQLNGIAVEYQFRAVTLAECKAWTRHISKCVDEATLISVHNKTKDEQASYGLHRSKFDFFSALQDGDIAVSDVSEVESRATFCTVADHDPDLPSFYASVMKHSIADQAEKNKMNEFKRPRSSSSLNHHQLHVSESRESMSIDFVRSSIVKESGKSASMRLVNRVEKKTSGSSTLPLSNDTLIREGNLFVSQGKSSKLVFVQLHHDILYQYKDLNCKELVTTIDLNTVKHAKKVDNDTFELHTYLDNTFYVFGIYDSTENATLWVNSLQNSCQIMVVEEADDDTSQSITVSEANSAIEMEEADINKGFFSQCVSCFSCCFRKPTDVVHEVRFQQIKQLP